MSNIKLGRGFAERKYVRCNFKACPRVSRKGLQLLLVTFVANVRTRYLQKANPFICHQTQPARSQVNSKISHLNKSILLGSLMSSFNLNQRWIIAVVDVSSLGKVHVALCFQFAETFFFRIPCLLMAISSCLDVVIWLCKWEALKDSDDRIYWWIIK